MMAAGRASRTVTERLALVVLLHTRGGLDPLNATWRELAGFLASPSFSVGTIQTYQSHMRAWFGWLVRAGVRQDDPTLMLGRPRSPRRVPRPVTDQELATLLSAPMYRRTRVMVLLAAYAGLRVHEIAQVRGEDQRGGTLRVVGKGGVQAALAIHPMIAGAAVSMPATGWWFPAPGGGGHLTPNGVTTTVGRAMRRAGVSGTAHSLRHWYATAQLRAGANIRVVQENMRHASLASTQLYTAVDDVERRDAILALPSALHVVSSRRAV